MSGFSRTRHGPPKGGHYTQRIDAILARSAFRHAIFGIEFYSLDTNAPLYRLNADKFFVPGSTTKLITMGSALQILGAGPSVSHPRVPHR